MSLPALADRAIVLGARAADWRDAVRLAGVAADGHLEAVAQLANAFNDAAAIPALAAATTRDAVRTILAGGGIT